jgi:hypothetical protein
LAARIHKMLAAGRITEDEADRVREAAGSGDLHAVVADIRLRHAQRWVDAAVADGRMTQAEADRTLERLARGEHPRPPRSGRRRRERQ